MIVWLCACTRRDRFRMVRLNSNKITQFDHRQSQLPPRKRRGDCFQLLRSPFPTTFIASQNVTTFICSLISHRSSRTEPPDLVGIMRVTDDMIDSLVCPPPPTDPPVMSEEMITGLIVPAPCWSEYIFISIPIRIYSELYLSSVFTGPHEFTASRVESHMSHM